MKIALLFMLAARITILAPNQGMQKDLEEGYKRHLEWHRANEDKWTWYGWTVTTGPRVGYLIDGTFGHDPLDFDAPVKPAEDAADNARNVFPYARVAGTAFYRQREDLSRGGAKVLEAEFTTLVTVEVYSGRERDFEAMVRGLDADRACFQLTSGGEHPTYLLFFPAKTISETIRDVIQPSDAYKSAVIETLRYRADLSYRPPDDSQSRH